MTVWTTLSRIDKSSLVPFSLTPPLAGGMRSYIGMRGRGATRRRTPTLEASQCQHPGCWRRASRPTSCPPRSRCCSSPHGEGTSLTHRCCSWCSHSRTPHGYRSSAAFWVVVVIGLLAYLSYGQYHGSADIRRCKVHNLDARTRAKY